jgi:CMP-N,N'-diacetyllegionaminic acid synthase
MNTTEFSMSKQNSYIAIIPARGGSKRLPGKNLLKIAGKPLIAWTIEAALKSDMFEQVYVNTDSEDIVRIAKQYGAVVPFLRPPELAQDQTTTVSVLEDMILRLRETGDSELSHLTLLQATSPLRSAQDIIKATNFLESNKADAVVSICRTEHSPLWSNTLPENGSLDNFIPDSILKTRSQELPSYYRLNGAIYICSIQRMMEEKTLFLSSNCFGYIMSRKNSIDIDDEIDFELADIYLRRSKASM